MQARLNLVLAKIEKADHFTALGLERKATAVDVKKAFFQLARELHPDTVQDGNTELRELKSRLFARVNEAAQVLSDEKRRKEHEDELDGKGNVDVARIFAAEEAFQRGEIMIKARKLVEGLALIDEAITLNADEGEFYAWRGWARFLLSKDRKLQHPLSAADCRKALAMIDKCVPALALPRQHGEGDGRPPRGGEKFPQGGRAPAQARRGAPRIALDGQEAREVAKRRKPAPSAAARVTPSAAAASAPASSCAPCRSGTCAPTPAPAPTASRRPAPRRSGGGSREHLRRPSP